MKLQSSSAILAAIVGMMCLAQSALAGPPPQNVPDSGTSLGLLVIGLGGLGLLKFLQKFLAGK